MARKTWLLVLAIGLSGCISDEGTQDPESAASSGSSAASDDSAPAPQGPAADNSTDSGAEVPPAQQPAAAPDSDDSPEEPESEPNILDEITDVVPKPVALPPL